MKSVQSIRQSGQFGGYAGQQCLFPAHILHTTAMLAKQHQLPDGALFIDIKGAFHCLLRELAMESRDQFPRRLQEVLLQEGFNLQTLTDLIDSSKFFGIEGADPLLARALQDAHRHTWFTMGGICMETHRGTRPGSPLADLVFNALVSVLIKRISEVLSASADFHQCSDILGVSLQPVVWVDDIAIPVVSTTNEGLLANMKSTLAVIQNIMGEYGFTLNLARGKTECICNFRGADSTKFRNEVFVDQFGIIEIPGTQPEDGFSQLRVAADYKHLGAKFAERASMENEVRHRLAAAQQAYAMLRRPIFANRRIPTHTRLQLLDALILPRLLYGCGRWPMLTAGQYRKLNAAVTRWHRTITGNGFWKLEEAMTDQRLRSLWKIPELSVRLAKHRLLYASQIWKHAHEVVWPFVCAETHLDQSWFAALKHSIGWMRSVLPEISDLNLECEPFSVIEAWLQENHHCIPAWSRRAVKRHLLQECTMAEVSYYHEKMKAALEHGGVRFSETQHEKQIGATYKCPDCNRILQSEQALAAHRWKAHGGISDERRFVFDGTCRACHKCFWSAQRLQQHLRYSKRKADGCYHVLARTMAPLDQAVPIAIPTGLKHHRLPCRVVEGPTKPLVPTWRTEYEKRMKMWCEDWMQLGLPSELPDQIKHDTESLVVEVLDQWFDDDPVLQPGQLMSRWLDAFMQIMEDLDCNDRVVSWAFLQWGEKCMYDHIEQWFSPDHQLYVEKEFMDFAEQSEVWWKMLQKTEINNAGRDLYVPNLGHTTKVPDVPRQVRPREPISCTYGSEEARLHELKEVEVTEVPPQRPPPVFRKQDGGLKLYILHLFSGRRRKGDIHHWVMEMANDFVPGVEVVMLSLDTAVHEECNLDNGPQWGYLLQVLEQGIFAGCATGPPCETWSAARHIQPDAPGHWPRPLRSAKMPWGLPDLSCKELRQLGMGTRLYLHSTVAEFYVYSGGGSTLKEHPKAPEDRDKVSTWDLHVNRCWVKALNKAWNSHVAQWKYGSVAVKPTTLRHVGCPQGHKVLRSYELSDVQYPSEKLEGKDDHGAFKTSKAKEYPSQLAKAIAGTLLSGIRDRLRPDTARDWPDFDENVQGWLQKVIHVSACLDIRETHLPDYQGR